MRHVAFHPPKQLCLPLYFHIMGFTMLGLDTRFQELWHMKRPLDKALRSDPLHRIQVHPHIKISIPDDMKVF